MANPVTGGCACGAIRYEYSGEPILSLHCYCRDCQRRSGTAFASGLGVPINVVKIKGEPRYYEVTADSGKKRQLGFCATCGSPLFTKLEAMPNVIGITPASLDDPISSIPASTSILRARQLGQSLPREFEASPRCRDSF